jgi:hypothetical protein
VFIVLEFQHDPRNQNLRVRVLLCFLVVILLLIENGDCSFHTSPPYYKRAKFLLLVPFHQEADHLLHKSRIQGCLSNKNVLTSKEEKVVVSADHENGLESANV